MPIDIKITDNTRLGELTASMRSSIQRVLRAEIPKKAAEIRTRTQSGQSIEGGGFAGYSAKYAAAKRKALGSSSPVNLTFTGKLLGGIRSEVQGIEAKITIDDEELARIHQTGDGVPARPFFGLSREQIRDLVEKIRNAVFRQ